MSRFSKGFRVVVALLCSALAFEGCSGKHDVAPPLGDDNPGGGSPNGGGTSTGGHASVDASVGGDAGPGFNCGPGLLCAGHSHCSLTAGATATTTGTCLCDTGYKRELADGGVAPDTENNVACVVDESCFKLHVLEKESCRYEASAGPAVGMFFAVDYCAGTAVLPDRVGDLTKAFQISEDGNPVTNSIETSATVIKHDVESYITFVLDFSGSMTANPDYVTSLIDKLRTVLPTPAAGDPPIGVSIIVFGRDVQQRLAFTRSATAVDTVLGSLETDPQAVTAVVGDNGTSINQAVETGINSTERIQALREGVTDKGVLTSGTVVVITDGTDQTGWVLNTDLIQNTRVNLLTIGIGTNVNTAALSAIGRDGFFLAPRQSDWAAAFQEVADRVQNYPKRTYLLGYCSGSTVHPHTMSVALNPAVFPHAQVQSASCGFNADYFGAGAVACTAATFTDGCKNVQCGGIAGCGACPDAQCCTGKTCQLPSATPGDCHDQDELCARDGKVCVPVLSAPTPAFTCVKPVPLGGTCDNNALKCDPTTNYCDPVKLICAPFPSLMGASCGIPASHSGAVCPTQNCSQAKAQNTVGEYVCAPPALAYDRCGGATASATCESGTACQLSPATWDPVQELCLPRQITGCTTDLDCITGYCESNTCIYTDACYYSWSDKIAG